MEYTIYQIDELREQLQEIVNENENNIELINKIEETDEDLATLKDMLANYSD